MLGIVDEDGERVAGPRALERRGGSRRPNSTGWRLTSRMICAAVDAASYAALERLDPLHQQAGHARGHVEAMRVARIDLDRRSSPSSSGPMSLGDRSSASSRWRRRAARVARGRSASLTITFARGRRARPRAARSTRARARRSRESAHRWSRTSRPSTAMIRSYGLSPARSRRRTGGHILHQRAVVRVSFSDACRSGSTSRSATPM